MQICNAHDQEVCYESEDCPACDLDEKIKELEAEIEKLKAEIDDLNQSDGPV